MNLRLNNGQLSPKPRSTWWTRIPSSPQLRTFDSLPLGLLPHSLDQYQKLGKTVSLSVFGIVGASEILARTFLSTARRSNCAALSSLAGGEEHRGFLLGFSYHSSLANFQDEYFVMGHVSTMTNGSLRKEQSLKA